MNLQGLLLHCLAHLIGPTLRFTGNPIAELDAIKKKYGKPLLFAVWHDETAACFWKYQRRQVGYLRENSPAGEALNYMASHLGYLDFPVSEDIHDRTTIKSTIGLIKHIRAGNDGVFAIDGPHGPYHQAKPGIFAIAEKTGAVIVGLRVSFSWQLRLLYRWDKYIVPGLFSKCSIKIIEIPLDIGKSENPSAALTQILSPS